VTYRGGVSGLNDERVITPEAVVLELHAAGPGSRILARMLDLAIQMMILGAFAIGLAQLMGSDTSTKTAVAIGTVLVLVVLLVLPILSETLWRGRTPGKLAMGIRVVTMDGSPISFRHAMVRGVFQLIEVYVPIGLLPLTLTRRSRRFGDLVAGTFALSERSFGAQVTATVFTPLPGLERYVADLDVSRMTDDQYVFVRSVLLRLPGVGDRYREHLCRQVADRLEQAVGVVRPQWLAPEPFLISVAGAYQVRSGTMDRSWVLSQAQWAPQPVGSPW
jgi:uncharacterized RDD family membrane protein YckC